MRPKKDRKERREQAEERRNRVQGKHECFRNVAVIIVRLRGDQDPQQ